MKSFGNMDQFSDPKAEDPRWGTETDDAHQHGYAPESWLTKGNNSQRPVDMREPGEWQAKSSGDMKAFDNIMRVGKELLDAQHQKWALMKQTYENQKSIVALKGNVMSMLRTYPNKSEVVNKLRELGLDHRLDSIREK